MSKPISLTTISLSDAHWVDLLTTARLHAYREVREMPNVTTAQCQQIVAAAVDGVRQQVEEWAKQQAADRNPEKVVESDAELHARCAHPDFEYRTTEGPRKQWDDVDVPPADENGDPDPTWERNTDAGRDGWDRFDYTEESYWRRRKTITADRATEK